MSVIWEVDNLIRKTTVGSLSDVVTSVEWRAMLTDSGYSASVTGRAELDDADTGNFTAYASITEANAIAWVKDVLGSDGVTDIENILTARIEELKVPVEKSGVPWGPVI
tara:strand:- start:234 stop:560 length:327 start_codon:yes stop_codon:yes gene_type:complete